MNVSVRSLQPVLARLRALGLDVAAVVSAAGIEPRAFEDADARLPHEAALALWDEAARRSGDDAFGIHTAESIRPGAFDVLDYATRSSATLGHGLQRLVRYHRILHDGAVVRLERGSGGTILTHALPGSSVALPRQVSEFIVAGWLVVARQATGMDFVPVEVRFRHPAPADASEHRRLFRTSIRFASAVNGLVLDQATLDAPLVKSDAGLCAVLDRHLAELLERIPRATRLTERVRHLVGKDLVSGVPEAAAVARGLHMSRRTLQRLLRNERTSYRRLVESLRRELAARYLTEQEIAIAEIAFLLGFSETSAFHRAFKRWTGRTPAAFRRS
jgi:AraC-like DNA-binding protein